MRLTTYVFVTILFSLSACSSQKKLANDPPFEVGKTTCQKWVGGLAESGTGMLLEIPISNMATDGVVMHQAYFRGMVTNLNLENHEGQKIAKANFMNKKNQKPDMIMSGNSLDEVGNQAPKQKEKFPFDLSPDQCVISYMEGNTVKYIKIQGIKEKRPLIYQ
ncbi:MAG: hypothetical protein HKO09_03580 [Croceitalea sp.]|nr:hypothetical protein [Croceitalea sp.]